MGAHKTTQAGSDPQAQARRLVRQLRSLRKRRREEAHDELSGMGSVAFDALVAVPPTWFNSGNVIRFVLVLAAAAGLAGELPLASAALEWCGLSPFVAFGAYSAVSRHLGTANQCRSVCSLLTELRDPRALPGLARAYMKVEGRRRCAPIADAMVALLPYLDRETYGAMAVADRALFAVDLPSSASDPVALAAIHQLGEVGLSPEAAALQTMRKPTLRSWASFDPSRRLAASEAVARIRARLDRSAATTSLGRPADAPSGADRLGRPALPGVSHEYDDRLLRPAQGPVDDHEPAQPRRPT